MTTPTDPTLTDDRITDAFDAIADEAITNAENVTCDLDDMYRGLYLLLQRIQKRLEMGTYEGIPVDQWL